MLRTIRGVVAAVRAAEVLLMGAARTAAEAGEVEGGGAGGAAGGGSDEGGGGSGGDHAAAAEFEPDPVGRWCLACGRSLDAGRRCAGCRGGRVAAVTGSPWPLVRLGRYDGALRRSVLAVKRERNDEPGRRIGRALGRQWLAVMARISREDLAGTAPFGTALVQPVPMPWLRRWERGTDHAAAIARGFADAAGLRVASLVGQRWGVPNARLHGMDRRGRRDVQRKSRFFLRSGMGLVGRLGGARRVSFPRAVVLVDDVRTSGSTLRELAELLRGAGYGPVAAAVVAVSHDSDHPLDSGGGVAILPPLPPDSGGAVVLPPSPSDSSRRSRPPQGDGELAGRASEGRSLL